MIKPLVDTGEVLTEQGILTRRASYAQVSHSSRKIAHTIPHAHATKEVVTGVQGGWEGRGVVEVGQIWQ